MKRRHLWFAAISLLIWSLPPAASGAAPAATNATPTAKHATAPVPPPVPAHLPADAVQVELFDGLPDEPSWNFSAGGTNDTRTPERYAEPVFGFAVFPTRYSERGIKVDRPPPFLLRASARVTLPKGTAQLLLRSRAGTRLWMNGKLVLSTRFPSLNSDGHEEVPELPIAVAPDIRALRPGQFEALTNVIGDGAEHVFTVEAVVGVKGRRPEAGDLCVAISEGDGKSFHLLSPKQSVALTEEGWATYEAGRREFHYRADAQRRQTAAASEEKYWQRRHERARAQLSTRARPASSIDGFIDARLATTNLTPAPLTDDPTFLRRATLDVIGTLPAPKDVTAFLADRGADKRARAIDRLLRHPGWAEPWVSYWQDVLAENPGIVKPMLNNTGPFRWWLRESFEDNKPMDRFATELILMEGSTHYGGPAGFGVATENDVPLAQKAQIVAQSFMGMELQCARCHDAPFHHFKQQDLFNVTAMLKREPQKVPLSSSIPTNANIILGRVVNVTLKPGSNVEPAWPFTDVMKDEVPADVLRDAKDSRERLAALVTSPQNQRFARVLANRVWKQYLGWGIVEPVDDWETATPSHPELLDFLADELATHDYNLKHLVKLILNSKTYQRVARPDGSMDAKPEQRFFAAPARRRMTAEQLVDSLFTAVGKRFDAEEMNMDVDGRRPVKEFNNLGTPVHAWEFTSLSNERDRPALAMPKAQSITDTLSTFGWRESRQNPQTVRDHSPNVLQPAALANSVLANGRVSRLSDDSAITALALKEQPLKELVHAVFLQVLSRPPTAAEGKTFSDVLSAGYDRRKLNPTGSQSVKPNAANRAVSWSNHLNPEATKLKQQQERATRAGDPPTERLRADWRERMEDMVWALVNSPEFVFVP